jgi:hypothetical protein
VIYLGDEIKTAVVAGRARTYREAAACAICFGAPALAAQSVTVALAIGAPAPRTRPLMLPAIIAGCGRNSAQYSDRISSPLQRLLCVIQLIPFP